MAEAEYVETLIAGMDSLDAVSLGKVISAAEKLRANRLDEARKALLTEMREKAAALQISLGDLVHLSESAGPEPKSAPTRRPKVVPRFRGPNGEEWTGRGKLPRWLSILEAEGKSRDSYRIGSVAQE